MSPPQDRYPNDDRNYPNERPSSPAPETSTKERAVDNQVSGTLPFHSSFEAELQRLAPSRATILLVGGTALERRAIAAALHEHSGRAERPYVVFDCSGLSSDDVEDRLFGGPAHAPTGEGAIERAGNGTLYVMAIDELPLLEQPRFLRFLDQERKVRVVACSVSDLLTLVERGHFRLDLAERLMLVELVLPVKVQSE